MNTTLEQVNMFTYLERNFPHEEEKVVTSKIREYLQILGILENVFNPNLDR
jgi:hypothetical protein